MYIGLNLREPTPPPLNKRYDVEYKEKFDKVELRRYGGKSFTLAQDRIAQFYRFRPHTGGFTEGPVGLKERLALADVYLRTQKRVGMVLGSTAARVIDKGYDFHVSDLDILVMNQHSGLNPRPFEWDTDWFVQPGGDLSPTNSNVKVIYQINSRNCFYYSNKWSDDMNERMMGSRLANERPQQSKLSEIINRKNSEDNCIYPGLYFPDQDVLSTIADYCNEVREKAQLRKRDYSYLVPSDNPGVGFEWPVLNADRVEVKKLIK